VKYLEETIEVEELKDKSDKYRVGDVIYLNGKIAIARDRAHKRLAQARLFVGDILRLPIYHSGPIAKLNGHEWVFSAAGPTTSSRMEKYIGTIVPKYHTPTLIGKGGFGKTGKSILKKYSIFYCELTGGASAAVVQRIEKVNKILFGDLGTSEALWVVLVKSFGPLLVTQDSKGNDLRLEIHQKSLENLEQVLKKHNL
jgi:tartrate/fumarate subfamily iron-sulfur-dependent hydro-lyase beta chain